LTKSAVLVQPTVRYVLVVHRKLGCEAFNYTLVTCAYNAYFTDIISRKQIANMQYVYEILNT